MTTKTRTARSIPVRKRKKKFSITIVGAGRLGLALGRALKESDHSINLVLTRTAGSARHAALALHADSIAALKLTNELPQHHRELIIQSDIIIIATPDDSIPHVGDELARLFKSMRSGSRARLSLPSVAVHTSGALSSDVIAPIRSHGIAVGSIHPLISISDQTTHRSFAGVYFALEGDVAAVRAGKRLTLDLGGNSFVISADKKPLYHAAALMASPNLTTLIDIAIEMMLHCGISARHARQMLLPLIQSTVQNLVHQEPRAALTGTFKRGDIDTVKKHLAAIASERLTDALTLYITLGARSLKLSNLPKRRSSAMNDLLTEIVSESRRSGTPT